jgi:predicted nucleic acid-binding protein
MTEASFVRLALNEALTGRKPSRTAVLAVLKGLRAWPGHVFLVDDTSLADPLIDLSGLMGHRQVTDLHLVNLAARHGAVLATLDHRIASGLMPGDQRIIHNVLA